MNINSIEYLLSSDNDIYLKRTWDTAHTGIPYAQSMGLKYSTYDFNKKYEGVFIFDTMIQEHECSNITNTINRFKDSLFFFKIIDPYYEYERDKYFFKLLFKLAKLNNVYFITNLSPQELTQELYSYTDSKKMLFLPYPYQVAKEIPCKLLDFTKRINKISYSGAVNSLIYPNRSIFLKNWKYNPFLWNKIEMLKHPSYLDKTNVQNHDIIGNKYLEFLSQYQIMYLDSSRSKLEFVKFTECAYAHCMPFGQVPISFNEPIKDYFKEIDYLKIYNSIKSIFRLTVEERFKISLGYRNIMKQERSVIKLQNSLYSFIDNIKL